MKITKRQETLSFIISIDCPNPFDGDYESVTELKEVKSGNVTLNFSMSYEQFNNLKKEVEKQTVSKKG